MNRLGLCALILMSGLAARAFAQNPGEITIEGYTFDPLRGAPALAAELLAPEPGPGVQHWRILQFTRPLDRATQTRLKSMGLELKRYVEGGAYIEHITPETLQRVQGTGLLRASVLYHPAFKLSPAIGKLQFRTPRPRMLLRALLFETAGIPATANAIRNARGINVREVDDRAYGGTGSIVFELASPNDLAGVARIEGIASVEEVAEQIDDNDNAAGLNQSGAKTNHSVWDQGLTGKGQIIGILDAGPVDMDHCFFRDPPIGSSHRKVIETRNATGSAENRHATFMAGSAAGDELNNSGGNAKRGGAWAAKLYLGNRNDITGGSMPSSMLAELGAAGLAQAYIHSNSWHSNNMGIYDSTAKDVDQYTWLNEDHLVLGSITNSEPPPLESAEAGPPGTAKNAIGVSAARLDLTFGRGVDGPTGPAGRPRRKPDLLAIGCEVESAVINTVCGTGTLDVLPPSNPVLKCDTSTATAHAAAIAVLARQYYTDGYYPTGTPQNAPLMPSGALIKATLLNSASYEIGTSIDYPNNTEGWGVVTLDRTLRFPGSSHQLLISDIRNANGLMTGEQSNNITVHVANSAVPLKVTLVWTDSPNDALVNDLDLVVRSPGALKTYVGNDFAGDVSTVGGARDRSNNVEQVLIQNPDPGDWKISVVAFNVAVGTQGYAVVATAGMEEPVTERRLPGAPTNVSTQ